MQAPTTTKPKAIFVAWLAIFLMSAEWILLVAGTHIHEMIVGAASVLASGAFLFVVHRSSTLHTDFCLSDIAKGWRIPWYVVSDIFVITLVLLKDLFGIEKAKSLFRVSGFQTGKKIQFLWRAVSLPSRIHPHLPMPSSSASITHAAECFFTSSSALLFLR